MRRNRSTQMRCRGLYFTALSTGTAQRWSDATLCTPMVQILVQTTSSTSTRCNKTSPGRVQIRCRFPPNGFIFRGRRTIERTRNADHQQQQFQSCIYTASGCTRVRFDRFARLNQHCFLFCFTNKRAPSLKKTIELIVSH